MNVNSVPVVLLTMGLAACSPEGLDDDITQQSTSISDTAAYKFETVDYPGFVSFNGPIGINKYGDTAGFYQDKNNVMHCYVRKNGQFKNFDYPGAKATWCTAITDSGDVAGTFFDRWGFQHGFVWRSGQYTQVDVPGAWPTFLVQFEFGTGLGTAGFAINDTGSGVGEYADLFATGHGWLKTRGQYITIDMPGALYGPGAGTSAIGVNDDLDVVGKYWSLLPPFLHGYLWERGKFTKVDVPKAGGLFGTQANGINDGGDIVGVYSDSNNVMHGFLRNAQARYIDIDVPGASNSECHYLNNRGDITGTYYDAAGVGHGFIAHKK